MRTIGMRAIGCLAAAVLLAASGCSGDSGESQVQDQKVEINIFWWGGEKRAQITEKALALYTSRHPKVTFKTHWQGNQGYYDNLATQAAGPDGPDLFQIDDNYLTEYADRKVTLDLTPYVTSGALEIGKLPDSLAKYGQVGGRQVGVASAENTPAMVYNRTLVRSLNLPEPTVGMTYDQLFEWATQITEATNGRVAGTMDPSADYKALWLWLRGQGKELYSGKQIGFTAADLTTWFEMWQTARDTGAAPAPAVIKEANGGDVTKQLVATGRAATSFMWSNQLPELQGNTKDELALVSYPGDPKGQWARASMYWSAFRGTRHPDVVVDVMNFLVNDPEAGKILGTERGLSPNTDVRKVVGDSLTDPTARATIDFENAITPRFGAAPAPPPKGHAKIRSMLTAAAESVQLGRRSPKQAAEQFLNQANGTLAT
ncbi:ABC transporter substrate-binding protein [Phytohabitans houttuyneae]|nr:extracellular solute-binding protein [Phytohabitans houttuyneae]